ncbi:uncharacterized protein ELE39_000851 [Cryptosporidium sp. chipmunk genotype I]|uniref:uncharacterized protein n=1 Tax=Cryptosporidium sp. chipmunk genotype I TaxID=1280935 RepID=UPI00351A399B|nr:hypothetical protein ELE39_000851 [Cryptosporidium sp. chipmunk genotype I]
MACLSQRLKVQTIPLILFVITFISLNTLFSEASFPRQKKELKSVKFVQKEQPPYVSSSNPGSYFRHLQTTVVQDSSSSPDESPEKELSRSKPLIPKYRFVHAPVGYEKSKNKYLAEIQSLKEANEKLNEEVKSQAQKIKALMAENKDLKDKIEGESQKTNSSNSKLKSLEEDLMKKERQNASLLNMLAQKERAINEQRTEITTLERRLQVRETTLESKEKSLSELEKQIDHKTQNFQMKEKELEKIKEHQESEALKLREKIETLSASVEDYSAKQAALENEKKQLESKLAELISERDNANKALNDCLESLNAKEVKTEKENIRKEVQPVDKKRALFDIVLKQMGERPAKEKWVKAPPLRRPEAVNVENELVPEIVKVFKSLREKKEKDFRTFVMENGLEHESKSVQEQMYEKYKEKNASPSPTGIQQFTRFKKEIVSD